MRKASLRRKDGGRRMAEGRKTGRRLRKVNCDRTKGVREATGNKGKESNKRPTDEKEG